MGYRWRRTYYLTGLPGWMRFGYSPGWVGRSPTGLPPTAEWIMSSGLMPQFREYLRTGRLSPAAAPYPTHAPLSKEEEVRMLEEQSKAIASHLNAVRKRLEVLRKSVRTEQPPYYSSTSYGYPPTPSPEEERASLEDYRRSLDEEVKGVEARIEELKRLREGKTST
ncbi:MAG: hypothetical protein QW158_02980 [Nitrososphaerales archaeon]